VAPESGEEIEIPAYALAHIELDAGRPGGGAERTVYAVPTVNDDLRIVITDDDGIGFKSPIERVAELPTLGELLQILDETKVEEETHGVGHPTRVASGVEGREELRSFLTITSDLYPDLEALDQARLEQWIA
jgi:hypothetical protein